MSNLKQKRFVDTDYLQENVIERLEILENVTEGQNMEYSTDQGFIHCTNTKKGRVNDLAIEGNTMVNYCRDGSKTLTLNGDINEVGTHITTTNAVNNGKVDVMCEGETLVNVCNQKDPIVITKAYTVENTNHVPLQGDYDGKARPIVEGNTLVNLTSSSDYLDGDAIKIDDNYFRLTASGTFRNLFYNKDKYKPNTKYTVIVDIRKNTLNGYFRVADATTSSVFIVDPAINIEQGKTGRFIYTLTTLSDLSECTVGLRTWVSSLCTEGVLEVRIMTLEGDLTANPPSGYIEGLKSSFEDQLVTSSSDPNYGKYKVEYKVTGKNKLKLDDLTRTMDSGTFTLNVKNNVVTATSTKSDTSVEHVCISPITIYLEKGKTYTMSFKSDVEEGVKPGTDTVEMYLLLNGNYDVYYKIGFKTTFTPSTSGKYNLRFDLNRAGTSHTFYDIQIEEGSSKTTYEAYKEYTKTFYLNSPLLEGDTIEDVNGKATHVRRSKQVTLDGNIETFQIENQLDNTIMFTRYSPEYSDSGYNVSPVYCDKFKYIYNLDVVDEEGIRTNSCVQIRLNKSRLSSLDYNGLRTYLSENPVKLVYYLRTPINEKISEESILTDSYVNGHLDLDTNVTVNKVDFRNASGLSLNYIQPNTNYVLQFEADNNGQLDISWLGAANIPSTPIQKGINKITVTTREKTNTWLTLIGIGFRASNISVVATEREFDYFEGLYSVGQDDENNHSIEITSRNKNLFNGKWYDGNIYEDGGETDVSGSYKSDYIKVKPNTTYICSNNGQIRATHFIYYDKNKKFLYSSPRNLASHINTTPSGCYYLRLVGATDLRDKFQIEEGNAITSYVQGSQNTKTLTLNEPLRSLPNGVKDRIVKMNNKWYVERNCGEIEVVSTMSISLWGGVPNTINNSFSIQTGIKNKNTDNSNIVLNCDKHIPRTRLYLPNTDVEGVCDSQTQGTILIKLSATKLTGYSVEAFKTWLTNNPFKITYQLATPIYEELTVEPTLNTYVDCTHISTNSVIPCDMTVKNSGYSTIIKPSTLYTIALDTNKSGEVKVNLGGAEKTTTNNIVTITTPSTLVDDSLRVSGKGLTSKNVRVFEGDNTNYIPNYFEGLKSSFEEKLGDNHIVEVVSENGDKSNKVQFSTLAPLRSVGGIKDKLVYKDNKWMIERNCMQIDLTSSLPWSLNATTVSKNSTQFVSKILNGYVYDSTPTSEQILCNKKPTKNLNDGNNSIWVYDKSTIVVQMDYRFIKTTSDFKKWLDTEKPYIVIPLTNPTYEEIGEYKNLDSYDEGTTISTNSFIAPKSLSFSLASHMSNIVKDVQDDVSELKTWRSEVFDSITHKKTFDSGFTTIEDTKEGVIEDVKLEGKTLVNLALPGIKPIYFNINMFKTPCEYTVAITFDSNKSCTLWVEQLDTWKYIYHNDSVKQGGNYVVFKFNSNGFDLTKSFALSNRVSGVYDSTVVYSNIKMVILEGDHTQNPPSYFEGLKSVGDDTDEIVVSSVNENLLNLVDLGYTTFGQFITVEHMDTNSIKLNTLSTNTNVYTSVSFDTFKFIPNVRYKIKAKYTHSDSTNAPFISIRKHGDNGTALKDMYGKKGVIEDTFVPTHTKHRIDFFTGNHKGTLGGTWVEFTDIQISIDNDDFSYFTQNQLDKKQLLFYNEETQTWEKPILREWDSIEKHSDGKYYYHRRSGEVVLNGSEDWKSNVSSETTISFRLPYSVDMLQNLICDRFIHDILSSSNGIEGILISKANTINEFSIEILKSKLSTQDVAGFKQWLQANNVTVVYQLAKEKVYECTNIELNCYDGETNVILDSGAISPITMVSLTSNLPQVAENLKNRVRQLEEEIYNYKVNQNLRQLRTFYKSDYANFGVATINNYSIEPTSIAITPYGYDLFEIFKEVIAQGKDKYDRIELEEYIDFYLMTFVFDFDMVFELFDLLDANEDIIEDEPVEEEPPKEEEEDVVEDTPTILPNLPGDEATPIPLI